MSPIKPLFFDIIQKRTHNRWNRLESDPEDKSIWLQMFSQVQSPQHVLSELLQNADDAGATWAKAYIEKDVFWFSHNGVDFDEESFGSLCRFGFSNKRNLHTIGFRGLGFKSTFSLGPTVAVITPTLSVIFKKERFTEPLWFTTAPKFDHTSISIRMDSPGKIAAVRNSLDHWTESAVPLLFFHNIQRLELQEQIITKTYEGPGPIPNSEWQSLNNCTTQRVLRIYSQAEAFPEDAKTEIRNERFLPDGAFSLPPCQVELILGLPSLQRLFVVLPTEVQPDLPFSCNAPFIQDPARTAIKPPELSPTNRWLLKRIGTLAAISFETWLNQNTLSLKERSKAYQLLPSLAHKGDSLDESCACLISEAFATQVENQPVLLSSVGEVVECQSCMMLPAEILDVWSLSELLNLFGREKYQAVLAPQIPQNIVKRLSEWHWIENIDIIQIIVQRLTEIPYPPRPLSQEKLIILWGFLANDAESRFRWSGHLKPEQWAIVPVTGSEQLHPAHEVVVISTEDQKLTSADLAFLSRYVAAVDPDWVECCSDVLNADRDVQTQDNTDNRQLELAVELFRLLALNRHGVTKIIDQAAQTIFAEAEPGQAGLELARIAARIDITISNVFRFLCRDGHWRSPRTGILGQISPTTATLLPEGWSDQHVLHANYEMDLSPDTRLSWQRWINSSNSQLRQSLLPKLVELPLYGLQALEQFCTCRGGVAPKELQLRSENFIVRDFDFPSDFWEYWNHQAQTEPEIWSEVVAEIERDWDNVWESYMQAEVRQEGRNKTYPLRCGRLSAAWLYKLQLCPCLPDTFGDFHLPLDLLRYTAETAPFQNIEPFVHPDYDQPQSQHFLELLGVRSLPRKVDKILERLKALSQVIPPPLLALADLYRALDRVVARLTSEETLQVRKAFKEATLIWTSAGCWDFPNAVAQHNPEEIPGIPTVFPDVAYLTFWEWLGISRQPTIEMALNWLNQLQEGQKLSQREKVRCCQILARAGRLVWEHCSHWLDLDSRWSACSTLTWGCIDRTLIPGLFPHVKQQTADFTMLQEEVNKAPVSLLPLLDSELEHRVEQVHGGHSHSVSSPDWLTALANNLLRIAALGSNDDEAPSRLEELYLNASRLQRSKWYSVSQIKIKPYLCSLPAGEGQIVKATWLEEDLYVAGEPQEYHRELVKTLASQFPTLEVKDAISACVGRDQQWITSYFASNFTLRSSVQPTPLLQSASDVSESNVVLNERVVTFQKTESGYNHSETVASPEIEIREKESQLQEAPIEVASDSSKHSTSHSTSVEEHFKVFLTTQGFKLDPTRNEFRDTQGERAIKVSRRDGVFDWIISDTRGKIVRQYWLADRYLEKDLVIPAEVWESMKMRPLESWLVVPDKHDGITLYRFDELKHKCDVGEFQLFVANYRLMSQ